MTESVELLPIGGLGEFGMNSLAIRFGDEIIIVDAGLMFPDVNHLGVDIIVPDYTYLVERRDMVKAIIITHSHEDHIGSLPYLLKSINVPVYTTPYTSAVLASKLDEHDLLDKVAVHTVEPLEVVSLGAFEVEFIRVSHSTTDCAAVAIATPIGVIIHTGDFKFDETPVCGLPIDQESLKRYGERGVLALLSDSTNIERPGRMPSEKAVIPALEEIFDKAHGRIVISCFTSSIHRIQIIFDLAKKFRRKVGILGRSMIRNIDVAESMRFLDVPDGITLSMGDVRRYDPEDVVLLSTGCQGEPLAALSRLAVDSYKQVKIEKGDTVILSARKIPGHERSIGRLINHIYKRGGKVIDSTQARIHVSGHGAQEDLFMMLQLTRPKFFIPIHGEYRQLYQHKEFAVELGYPDENVLLAESGEVIELTQERVRVIDKVAIGRIFIDDNGTDTIEDIIVRERKHLAYDGIILPIVAVNEQTRSLVNRPEIITRGFSVPENGSGDYLKKLAELVSQTFSAANLEERKDDAVIKEKVRLELKRFIQRNTGRRPLIMPVIMEV